MIEGSKTCTPDARPETAFYDPDKAVAYLNALYQDAVGFLQSRFDDVQRSGSTGHRYRAFYPQISLQVDSFRSIDSRLSFALVAR